jgi:serine/threonine protein kinase
MKEREALGYTSEVLDILDYLAQETPPIVHRDIKPANILEFRLRSPNRTGEPVQK